MSCLCRDCIADYLESLVKKVREEVKEEKESDERDKWDNREFAEHCGL